MALVKVRRDGNSVAVTIPAKEARKAHLEEGTYVNVEIDEASGVVRIEPVSIQPRVPAEIISVGQDVLRRNGKAVGHSAGESRKGANCIGARPAFRPLHTPHRSRAQVHRQASRSPGSKSAGSYNRALPPRHFATDCRTQ